MLREGDERHGTYHALGLDTSTRHACGIRSVVGRNAYALHQLLRFVEVRLLNAVNGATPPPQTPRITPLHLSTSTETSACGGLSGRVLLFVSAMRFLRLGLVSEAGDM